MSSPLAVPPPGGLWVISPNKRPYDVPQDVLEHPALSGVFIRAGWSDCSPGYHRYDFSAVVAQAERIVRAGKWFSVGFKSGARTPKWVFGPDGAVVPIRLPGVKATLGSPCDIRYGRLYGEFLEAAAEALAPHRSRLAAVKLQGVSQHTHEVRTHKTREQTLIWADAGRWRPSGVLEFFVNQGHLVSRAFPGRALGIMHLNKGLPGINERGKLHANARQQMESILTTCIGHFGPKWFVQNNALGVRGQPNDLVQHWGRFGQHTALQTIVQLHDAAAVNAAIANAYDNSSAACVELYGFQFRHIADTTADSWSDKLLARRREWLRREAS